MKSSSKQSQASGRTSGTRPPYLGFGLGLRPQHYTEILDGNPLRLRRAPDGFVVYSVSRTKTYDGTWHDNLDHTAEAEGDINDRIEFRLWNPDRRRQPAMERKKDAVPELPE